MHAEVLAGVIQHGIEEARVMMHRLRPPELATAGLEPALRNLLVARGIEGRVLSDRNPAEDRLSPAEALGLYRMVEALLEPAPHTGEPWHVHVAIARSGEQELQLEVTVAGERVALDSERMRALAEPIEAINGRLQLISHDGSRTVVRALWVPASSREGQ
jgi:signal transduction histidine kinase